MRPVLLSTELSSFIRLDGIIASPPRAGLLLMVLQPLWGGMGKAMGCKCLDGDGEGRRCGWQTSTEGLLYGTSGALSTSVCFGAFVLWWTAASLVGLGLPSSRETLLSVSCGQILQINMNCKRLNSSKVIFHVGRDPWSEIRNSIIYEQSWVVTHDCTSNSLQFRN